MVKRSHGNDFLYFFAVSWPLASKQRDRQTDRHSSSFPLLNSLDIIDNPLDAAWIRLSILSVQV